MGKPYVIRPATLEDGAALAAVARSGDRREALALGAMDVGAAVRLGVRAGGAETAVVGDEVAAVWGCPPASVLTPDVGAPWLLTGRLVDRFWLDFARESRRIAHDWREQYPGGLRNVVDAEYTRAVAWLEWVGFAVHAPEPMGPWQRPFRPFTMGAG